MALHLSWVDVMAGTEFIYHWQGLFHVIPPHNGMLYCRGNLKCVVRPVGSGSSLLYTRNAGYIRRCGNIARFEIVSCYDFTLLQGSKWVQWPSSAVCNRSQGGVRGRSTMRALALEGIYSRLLPGVGTYMPLDPTVRSVLFPTPRLKTCRPFPSTPSRYIPGILIPLKQERMTKGLGLRQYRACVRCRSRKTKCDL